MTETDLMVSGLEISLPIRLYHADKKSNVQKIIHARLGKNPVSSHFLVCQKFLGLCESPKVFDTFRQVKVSSKNSCPTKWSPRIPTGAFNLRKYWVCVSRWKCKLVYHIKSADCAYWWFSFLWVVLLSGAQNVHYFSQMYV